MSKKNMAINKKWKWLPHISWQLLYSWKLVPKDQFFKNVCILKGGWCEIIENPLFCKSQIPWIYPPWFHRGSHEGLVVGIPDPKDKFKAILVAGGNSRLNIDHFKGRKWRDLLITKGCDPWGITGTIQIFCFRCGKLFVVTNKKRVNQILSFYHLKWKMFSGFSCLGSQEIHQLEVQKWESEFILLCDGYNW